MTPQELLKPRYKCIANFPQWSSFRIEKGDILIKQGIHFCGGNTSRGISEFEIDEYPDVLCRLEWWEERDWSELEEVKYVKTHAGNSVRTVKEFQTRLEKIVLVGGKVRPIKHWIPATEEEYEAFKCKTIHL